MFNTENKTKNFKEKSFECNLFIPFDHFYGPNFACNLLKLEPHLVIGF